MVFFVVSGLLSTALSLLISGFRLLAADFFAIVDVEDSGIVALVAAAVFALVVLVGTADVEGVALARELALVGWVVGLDAMAVANEDRRRAKSQTPELRDASCKSRDRGKPVTHVMHATHVPFASFGSFIDQQPVLLPPPWPPPKASPTDANLSLYLQTKINLSMVLANVGPIVSHLVNV